MNDVWVGETKIGEKQSGQSNSKNNFMQYVFFDKSICREQWSLQGKAPEA